MMHKFLFWFQFKILKINHLVDYFGSLRIVYYHLVSDIRRDYYFNSSIGVDNFKRQIEFLKGRYEIISLSEALVRAKNGDSLKNCLCLTFDDGFSDCYFQIYPILKRMRISGTFFLIENTVNNRDLMWRNKLLLLDKEINEDSKRAILYRTVSEFGVENLENGASSLFKASSTWSMSMKEEVVNFIWSIADLPSLDDYLEKHKPYLDDDQIFEMLNNNMEFGNHTKSHPFCSQLSEEEIWHEIIATNQRMSSKFGTIFNSLSYPFGDRVSKDIEKYIRDNSTLEILLGIKDEFNNYNNPFSWERVCLEKPYYMSLNTYYLKVLLRKCNLLD